MRLIDADRLKRRFKARGCFKKDMIGCMVAQIISTEPTIDAVPVVRCKDCKHLVLTEEGDHNPNDCVCDYWMTDGLKDDNFCFHGERKDNVGKSKTEFEEKNA